MSHTIVIYTDTQNRCLFHAYICICADIWLLLSVLAVMVGNLVCSILHLSRLLLHSARQRHIPRPAGSRLYMFGYHHQDRIGIKHYLFVALFVKVAINCVREQFELNIFQCEHAGQNSSGETSFYRCWVELYSLSTYLNMWWTVVGPGLDS